MIDYNDVLKQPWQFNGFDVIYQPNCLQIPTRDDGIWDIKFPPIDWTDNTVVIMHCQDFLNISDDGVRELSMIETYFGKRSSQVVVVVWNFDLQRRYQGPLNLCYFPTHSYSIISNLNDLEPYWRPIVSSNDRPIVFQCLNGATRKHRMELITMLGNFPSKIISFGNEIPLQQWPYSTYRGTENEDNFIRLLSVYSNCWLNIVSETQYDQAPGIITEKTLFALLSRQIPILIGYQGIVADLASLGFDIFDDIIDTTYDQCNNDIRIKRAINMNRLVLEQGINTPDIITRLNANQELVMSWPQRMMHSYFQQSQSIMSRMT